MDSADCSYELTAAMLCKCVCFTPVHLCLCVCVASLQLVRAIAMNLVLAMLRPAWLLVHQPATPSQIWFSHSMLFKVLDSLPLRRLHSSVYNAVY